jgi:hypothetical protein
MRDPALNFLELREGEVRRISIPRTPVNKGKKAEAVLDPDPLPLGD